jgi:hypothetical protein
MSRTVVSKDRSVVWIEQEVPRRWCFGVGLTWHCAFKGYRVGVRRCGYAERVRGTWGAARRCHALDTGRKRRSTANRSCPLTPALCCPRARWLDIDGRAGTGSKRDRQRWCSLGARPRGRSCSCCYIYGRPVQRRQAGRIHCELGVDVAAGVVEALLVAYTTGVTERLGPGGSRAP